MKKTITFCTLMFICSYIFATVLIVDNRTPIRANTYASIKTAQIAANNGDTLYLTPSETEYTGDTIIKNLQIIGVGWDRPSPGMAFTRVGAMYFDTGSDGSSLQSTLLSGSLIINANGIVIAKNKITCQVNILQNHHNIMFIQNYIRGKFGNLNYFSPIFNIEKNNNCIMSNNFLINDQISNIGESIIYTEYPNSLLLTNNIFSYNEYEINNIRYFVFMNMFGNEYCNNEFSNNIIICNIPSYYNSTFIHGITNSHNNLYDKAQFSNGIGDSLNIDKYSIFEDFDNGNYHLKAPYLGNNYGIYEGEFPFIDGGFTGFPVIYKLNVPMKASKQDGLNIEIKVRANN